MDFGKKELISIQVEDYIYCVGYNFEYKKVGNIKQFTQKGKIPSLRILKKALKDIEVM